MDQNRFVTKYALTKGIFVISGDVTGYGYFYYGKGVKIQVAPRDHFGTIEEARARAREIRDRKIKALENQIAKLRGLTFETAIE